MYLYMQMYVYMYVQIRYVFFIINLLIWMSIKDTLLICLCLWAITADPYVQWESLKNWSFRIQNQPYIYNTTTPSTFARDLMKYKLVSPDPYFRDNFLKFYEYQTKNVQYSTTFSAPTSSQGPVISQLVFEGLDTHTDIYLNGRLIQSTHNMFRRYVINITNLTASNNLTVMFYSSARYDEFKQKQFYDEFNFKLPSNFSFSRKPAYQYGWDWGPRIVTAGIWKQAYIIFGYVPNIDNLRVKPAPVTQKHPSQINFAINSRISQLQVGVAYSIKVSLQRNGQVIIASQIPFTATSQSYYYDKMYKINSSYIKNVSSLVWWTWDLGQPNLVNLTLSIEQPGRANTTITKTVQTGFRTVTVIQEKDSVGTSFTVNLNGIDTFMRGGNYIPPQMSMDIVNQTQYDLIRKYAIFAKYNMIRVWGGGQFEHDQFYRTMDEAGILIWHDLMFACALYPIFPGSDDHDNIKMEMEDNLNRIGHHPSIGIWNGNNQVWIGWQEWGWKKGLDVEQIYAVQHMYKQIFQKILPEAINKITPDIFYWQTSPSSSSSQLQTIGSGDIHFWRVWGGGTPIQEYQQYIGRFNSEYGMQSMPEYSTITKFTNSSDRVLNSQVLRLHERHIFGDKYLPMYTNKYAGVTDNLKRFAYYSQVMQAYALQLAIVSLRGNKPICMGSLYWQLNDVWPVSSWASVDYYGAYKASHYRIRNAYNQLLVHTVHTPKNNITSQNYKVVAVNDYDKKIGLFCTIKILDFNGTVINNFNVEKTVNPFENLVLMRFTNFTNVTKNRSFINTYCRDVSGQAYTNNYFFSAPADRVKIDPKLQVKSQGQKITIKANALANYVWIRAVKQEMYLHVENNYFDLLPGENITVRLPVSASDVEVTCFQCEVLKQQLQKKQANLKTQVTDQ